MPTLDWIGKEAVRQHHHEVPFHLLREVPDLGAGDPEAGNLLVQGDNLVALKALMPTHAGTVKCVYIDPPYNTGNEGWVYNDNVNSPAIRAWLDRAVGKEAEDLGRHDKWLCMMYPRLVLLRELLADDGSLWMSLDDNEVHHARAVLDEVFGAQNFVASFVWEKRTTRENRAAFSTNHDHILCYGADRFRFEETRGELPLNEEVLSRYANPDDDPRGDWQSVSLNAQAGHGTESQFYTITLPSGRSLDPPPGRCWIVTQPNLDELIADGRVWFGHEGNNAPRQKKFLSESERGLTPHTLWTAEEVGTNDSAKKEFIAMLPEVDSSLVTPKPTDLVQRIVRVATVPGDLVLDSFAGSGTTGHAVLKQNAEDGGDRRFILVEMEDDVARPVTAERLRRAIDGYPFEGKDRTELYRQKVTVTSFKKGTDHYAKAQAIKDERAGDFDAFEQKVEKGHFVLYGVNKIKAKKEGLGGGFDFYEIGEPVYDADGRLNEAVPYEALGRYAYYAQTGRPAQRRRRRSLHR